MAFNSANLALISSVNGFGLYRYDTTDDIDLVEDAAYMDNQDDQLNLGVGDKIEVVVWATAVRTGTIAAYKDFIVTNVITDATSAYYGQVNLAEIGVSTAGAISSGD